MLIDAVKTSIQITKPRGSYLKERWQKIVSVHGTARRDRSLPLQAQEVAAGHGEGTVGAGLGETESHGQQHGCERPALDVLMWPVAGFITITAIQSTFLWRKDGQGRTREPTGMEDSAVSWPRPPQPGGTAVFTLSS